MESIRGGKKPSQRAVKPQRGVVAYVGGKRNLARRIIARIEEIPHTCYAEPFVGAGGVFFRRRRASEVEAINDYSRDVFNLFRVLQVHYAYFINEMRFQLARAFSYHLRS